MVVDFSSKKSKLVSHTIILMLLVFFIYKVLNSSFPLVFDEAIYFDITKSFIEGKYSYEFERSVGSAHYPLFYFINSIFIGGITKLINLKLDERLFRFLNNFFGLISVIPLYFSLKKISGYNDIINSFLILIFYLCPVVFIYTWFGGGEGLGLFFTLLFIYYTIKYHVDQSEKFLVCASTFATLSVLIRIYCAMNLFVLGILVLYKKEFRRFAVDIVVYPLIFVILLSFILFKDPLLEFRLFNEILTTTYTLPLQSRNPVLISSIYGLGISLLLISLIGFIVTKKNEIIPNFIMIGVVLYLIYFNTTFHYVRHLWVIVPFAIVATKHVFDRLFSHKKSILCFLILIILIEELVFIGSAMSVVMDHKFGIIGDWTTNQGYKNYEELEFESSTNTWGLTNGHYPVLKHYTNMDFYFYNGHFDGSIYVYKIWDNKSKKPNVVKVSGEDEQQLKYIVLDYIQYSNVSDAENSVFYPDIAHAYARIDNFLIYYTNTYFERVQSFQHEVGETVLYKRNTPNLYSHFSNPFIYIGCGGDNLTNYNGWISGSAWSYPQEVKTSTEKLKYRVAKGGLSEGQHSEFVIYNAPNTFNLTLEIINPILLNNKIYQFNIYSIIDNSTILIDKIKISADNKKEPLISKTVKVTKSHSPNKNNLDDQQHFLIESDFVPIHKIMIGG